LIKSRLINYSRIIVNIIEPVSLGTSWIDPYTHRIPFPIFTYLIMLSISDMNFILWSKFLKKPHFVFHLPTYNALLFMLPFQKSFSFSFFCAHATDLGICDLNFVAHARSLVGSHFIFPRKVVLSDDIINVK